MYIISRAAARERGLKRFFTGRPCIHGHISERNVGAGYCCECVINFQKMRFADAEERKKINDQRRLWRERNIGHVNKLKRKWSKDNKAASAAWWERNADKKRLYNRRSYEKTRAARIEYAAQWRRNNPVQYKKCLADWRAKNKEKSRKYQIDRRSREAMSGGTFTAADIKRIFKEQRGRCAYCKCKLGDDYQIDHIVSLSAGGSNWPSNLQLTCGISGNRCNLKKRSKDPVDFARSLGLLI